MGGDVASADPAADLVELGQSPSMSARSTISVFACGMSRPDSMIVVVTSTSKSPRRKRIITSSSLRSGIWPCATPTRSSGTHSRTRIAASSIVSTRLWR